MSPLSNIFHTPLRDLHLYEGNWLLTVKLDAAFDLSGEFWRYDEFLLNEKLSQLKKFFRFQISRVDAIYQTFLPLMFMFLYVIAYLFVQYDNNKRR